MKRQYASQDRSYCMFTMSIMSEKCKSRCDAPLVAAGCWSKGEAVWPANLPTAVRSQRLSQTCQRNCNKAGGYNQKTFYATSNHFWSSRTWNSTKFLDVMPCSLVEYYQSFGGTYCLHLQCRRVSTGNRWLAELLASSAYSVELKKLVRFSVTCVTFYKTALRHILEHCILYIAAMISYNYM
jgi:hypothetical protein